MSASEGWLDAVDLLLQPAPSENTPEEEVGELNDLDRVTLQVLHHQLLAPYLIPIDNYIQRFQKDGATHPTLNDLVSLLQPLIALSEAVDLPSQSDPLKEMMTWAQFLISDSKAPSYSRLRPLFKGYEALILALPNEYRPPRDIPHFYQTRSIAFLEAMRNVRNVGPKRIQRLYSAGLVDAPAVAQAESEELHHVTGIGAKLSAAVIEAAGHFIEEQTKAHEHYMIQMCADLSHELKGMSPENKSLLHLISPRLQELRGIIDSALELTQTTL